MTLFYLLVFTLPIPNNPVLAFHVGPLTVLKCLGIVCLLVAIFEMIRTGRFPAFSPKTKAGWFLAYFVVVLISCFAHDGVSAFGTPSFMYTLSTFSLFLMTTTFVRTVKHVRWAVLIAMGSVAWGSLYVVRQWQQYHNIYIGFRTFGGMAGDPNYYAVTVVLWTPLMIFWLMTKRPKWEKWFVLACLVPILLGFIFAASRGGFIGLSVALVFLIWHTKKRMRTFAIVALFMLPILLAPGQSALNRLLNPGYGDEESTQFRLELWEASQNSFINHPIFGTGLGHFHPFIIRNGGIIEIPFHVAHNTYVGVLTDLGLAGGVPFLALLFGSFRRLYVISRQRTGQPEEQLVRATALGLQAGLLGYMVCAFFLSTLWVQVFWFAVFLAMCLPRIQDSCAREVGSARVARQNELAHASA